MYGVRKCPSGPLSETLKVAATLTNDFRQTGLIRLPDAPTRTHIHEAKSIKVSSRTEMVSGLASNDFAGRDGLVFLFLSTAER
jgi:hypothetical protein